MNARLCRTAAAPTLRSVHPTARRWASRAAGRSCVGWGRCDRFLLSLRSGTLLEEPVAERDDDGVFSGAMRADGVVRKSTRQHEFERLHELAVAERVRHERAAAERYTVSLD